MESLLAEQIMFCNKLLLTKNDRLPFYVVTEVARAIHPLNPQVAIMAVPWGNLQLDELLSMPDYDFHRVALLIDEARMPLTQFCRMKPIKIRYFVEGH